MSRLLLGSMKQWTSYSNQHYRRYCARSFPPVTGLRRELRWPTGQRKTSVKVAYPLLRSQSLTFQESAGPGIQSKSSTWIFRLAPVCRVGNVYEASHSRFSQPIIVKFARFAWGMGWLESETAAYGWIDGRSIGPDFLGHVTEHGRVIGSMTSRVENARHATPQDYIRCREALQVLHGMGIKHGDINKYNFLLHGDSVTLIDFEMAAQNSQSKELQDELEHLEEQLNDTSRRGAPVAYGEAI
nr:hypothetical protein CFP56_28763 [Quercus suber]